ncbi:MAG: response regulator [Armatimonadota bacterium]
MQQSAKGYILLVDDEPTITRYMQKALERKGYNTDFARNGNEALIKIRKNRPDLVVSDVMMPEMDGFDLLGVIRRDPALMDLPVLMLTARPADFGYDDNARMQQWFATTAGTETEGYLVKPVNPELLIKAVEHILSTAQVKSQQGGLGLPQSQSVD